MLDNQESMDATRAQLREQARASWPGQTGEQRAKELDRFLDQLLASYSQVLEQSQADILQALEDARTYSVVNYYQAANFPSLHGVALFDTVEQFKARYPLLKYRCPACEGVSSDAFECDSGVIRNGKKCDWKAYGLFRTMGKGMRVAFVKDFLKRPIVYEIFMPVEAIGESATAAVPG